MLDKTKAETGIAAVMQEMGAAAKAASHALSIASTEQKNKALTAMASAIESATADILAANAEDLARAVSSGLAASFIDRLTLTDKGRRRDCRRVSGRLRRCQTLSAR